MLFPFGAVPILKPLNRHGNSVYHSIIIVREDSPIRTLRDLKGRSFAFGSLHSTSGNLIPRHFQFEKGITLFDLKSYVNLDSHDAVAKAVLKGKVATRRGLLPVPNASGAVISSRPTAALFSSTRSGRSPRPCRSGFCVFSKRKKSGDWAGRRRSPPISA